MNEKEETLSRPSQILSPLTQYNTYKLRSWQAHILIVDQRIYASMKKENRVRELLTAKCFESSLEEGLAELVTFRLDRRSS